jgi:hypothetical protein
MGFVLLCVALGAGAIALWVHVRIGSGPLAPQNLRTALLHVGASLVVGQLAVPLLMKLLVGGSPLLNLVAIFLIAFPADLLPARVDLDDHDAAGLASSPLAEPRLRSGDSMRRTAACRSGTPSLRRIEDTCVRTVTPEM